MKQKTKCAYCHKNIYYKTSLIPLYCSTRCRSLGHKQTIENKRKKLSAITKCQECGCDITYRKYLKPICKGCKNKKKREFQKQICTPSKSIIEPIKTQPEYIERGDLCFLKEDRLKRVESNE